MTGNAPSRDLPTPGGPPRRATSWKTGRPAALVVACAIVLVEVVLTVGLGVLALVELIRGESQVPGAMVFFTAFCLLVAFVLVAAARSLLSGRRWGRSPIVTWQVLLGVMALGWYGADHSVATGAVLVAAAAVVVCLLVPSVVAFTTAAAPGTADGPDHEPQPGPGQGDVR